MLTPEALFPIANQVMLPLWLLLAASLWVERLAPAARWLSCVIVPVVMGALYAGLVAVHMPGAEGGFDSITEVRTFFSYDALLLAGWVHYLAFDFFVGGWMVRHREGVPKLLVVPCLFFTLMFGPTGLLFFLMLRAFTGRRGSAATVI